MSPSSLSSSARRHDLDWLRVILILAVLVFHSLRFFNLEGWHVKNPSTYLSIEIVIAFMSRWMMPAIFIVSGVATFYALGSRSAGRFLRDRSLRLLVPLGVGLLTHVPIQGYLEARQQTGFTGSFWQYYAAMFNGLAGLGGNFNWVGNHLWYVEVLFALSLISLPLFLWMRRGGGQRTLAWLGDLFSRRWAIYLLALPTVLLLYALNGEWSWVLTGDGWGGWNIPNHLIFFLAGFVLASSAAMQANVRRMRWVSLIAAVVLFPVLLLLYLEWGDSPWATSNYLLLQTLNGLESWAWILAIFGFGLERLNVHNAALDYANEAVMPFYVLHQSVLVIIGYFVVQWNIPDVAKWAIILISSFAAIMLVYELLVRRINVLRVLFGMKPVHRETVAARPLAQAR